MTDSTPSDDEQPDRIPWETLSWWLTLLVAVLAIPSFGFIIIMLAGIKGTTGVFVFMVCCWIASYFAMQWILLPHVHKNKDFTKDS